VTGRSALTVAIIGAGFGGLAAAVALKRAGIDDVTIVEQGDGVGGTWRRNTYPGAACDIQSHLYSFSFAPNPEWTRTYAGQPEILAYLERVADEFDLRRHLRSGTRVRRALWQADASQWRLELESYSGTTTLTANVVVSAVGLFGAPNLPDIEGLADYAGTLMHTSRWDGAIALDGKRVAVIGTGASGVQVIPELAEIASRLTVFQRTPPWMLPKDDRPFDDDERHRYRNESAAVQQERERLWTEQHVNTALRADDPRVGDRQQLAKTFLDAQVADPLLREALTPDYPFRCKRVLLGANYYAVLQHEHVELVTDPIARIDGHRIVTASGQTVDADAIVLATGFETSRYLAGIEVIGEGGQELHERWGDDPQAYLGVAVSGFPNFFMLYGPNTNQGGNSIVYVLEAGACLVVDAVERLARAGGQLAVRPEAEAAFNQRISNELEGTVWTQCDSYFRSPSGRIVTQWPYTEQDYERETRALRPGDWIHRHASTTGRAQRDVHASGGEPS